MEVRHVGSFVAPIQPGSTGNKFLFVPLRDKATVDRAVLDVRAMLEAMGERPRMGIFVFAPDPDAAAGRVYSRMFGPHSSGIPEDPATGSASGPLGAYLVLNGMVKGSDDVKIVSEQVTTERLRELESEGLVRRTVMPGPPVRVSYELTEAGKSLEPVIESLGRWAERWVKV